MSKQTAFPNEYADGLESRQGMLLRDYFAAKAMQAYVSRPNWDPPELKSMEGRFAFDQLMARYAYEMADAMLAAREK
jgi:hypothetical protein